MKGGSFRNNVLIIALLSFILAAQLGFCDENYVCNGLNITPDLQPTNLSIYYYTINLSELSKQPINSSQDVMGSPWVGNPDAPYITGPGFGYVEQPYYFTAKSSDPDGGKVMVAFDWNDGTRSMTPFVESGTAATAGHIWSGPGTYHITAIAIDDQGESCLCSGSIAIEISEYVDDNRPSKPLIPKGPSIGRTGVSYTYSTLSKGYYDHQICMIFNWGDGTATQTSFMEPNIVVSESHIWDTPGQYMITVRALDDRGYMSHLSGPQPVEIVSYDPDDEGTPSKPEVMGPSTVYVGESGMFSAISTSPGDHYLGYEFDWGDGSVSTTGILAPGLVASLSHSWQNESEFEVVVRSYDLDDVFSDPSSIDVNVTDNHPPDKPSTPFGPGSGYPNVTYQFSSSSRDEDGDPVSLIFDWGDGDTTTTDLYPSQTSIYSDHSWNYSGSYVVHVTAKDELDHLSDQSDGKTITVSNRPPDKPIGPSGPNEGVIGTNYSYYASANDPDGDLVMYTFDWGDGTTTDTEYVESNALVGLSHSWNSSGRYPVKVWATDNSNATSYWSSIFVQIDCLCDIS